MKVREPAMSHLLGCPSLTMTISFCRLRSPVARIFAQPSMPSCRNVPSLFCFAFLVSVHTKYCQPEARSAGVASSLLWQQAVPLMSAQPAVASHRLLR